MTDGLIRGLERTWKASGLCADQAELLRQRMRAGQLDLSALELAAYCGCAASRIVLGTQDCDGFTCCCDGFVLPRQAGSEPSCPSMNDHGGLNAWLGPIRHWPGVDLRTALSAAETALPVWEASDAAWCRRCGQFPDGDCPHCYRVGPDRTAQVGPKRAIGAARDYVLDPCAANKNRAIAAGRRACGETPWAAGPAFVLVRHYNDFALAVLGADLVAKGRVREKVKTALIDWALA